MLTGPDQAREAKLMNTGRGCRIRGH